MTNVEIKLSPRSHVSDPSMLARNPTHGGICEPVSNGPAHNADSLNMLRYFGESREQERNVGQGPGCDDPGFAFGLGEEGIPHCENGVLVCYGRDGGFG